MPYRPTRQGTTVLSPVRIDTVSSHDSPCCCGAPHLASLIAPDLRLIVPLPPRACIGRGFKMRSSLILRDPLSSDAWQLSGNVWEWTRSLWDAYPYPSERIARSEREDLPAPAEESRVLRGGAFWSGPQAVRCACRDGLVARVVYHDIGFRVALAGPP